MSITKRIPIAIGIKPNQVTTFTNKTIDGSQNTLQNIPNNALENNTISINGSPIPLGGNINLQVEGGNAIVDTNTTYSIKASAVSGGANLDLDAGGSGTGTDSIKFEGGGAVTVTRVDANTIRISDVGSLGGVALTSESVATLSNKTISGTNNTLTNIPNSALTNNYITINSVQVPLGGSINVSGGGGGSSANTTETLTNKTISGSDNTLTNIPNSALLNPLIIINGTTVPLGSSFDVAGLGDVTLTGTQTLTNKSLIQPQLDRIRLVGTVTAGAGSGSVGNVGQVLTSTGTGVQWSTPSTTNATTQFALSFGSGLTALSSFNGSSEVTASIDTNVVATLSATQTLTNKTLTSPVISSITNSGTLTLPTGTDNLVSRNSTDTLSNKTINNLILSGTLNAGGAVGTSGQVLTSTGSGVQWSSLAGGGGGATNLDGLIDVVISTPSNGQVLKFNGSNWVNDTTLAARTSANGTASSLGASSSTNMTFSAAKAYALMKVETSCAAWIRIYADSASRTLDQNREITSDPSAGVDIMTEVITTGAQTQLITPGIFAFNNDSPVTDFVYIRVTNLEGTTQDVTVTLTYLPLE
jgi:hypothetical protein